MKYRIGAKLRVTQVYSGGNFDIGDLVEVSEIGCDDDADCYGCISPWDGLVWYLQEDEVTAATNLDNINGMDIDEKAAFIKALMFNDIKPACKVSTFFSADHKPECEMDCVSCIKEWLQQSYKKG